MRAIDASRLCAMYELHTCSGFTQNWPPFYIPPAVPTVSQLSVFCCYLSPVPSYPSITALHPPGGLDLALPTGFQLPILKPVLVIEMIGLQVKSRQNVCFVGSVEYFKSWAFFI